MKYYYLLIIFSSILISGITITTSQSNIVIENADFSDYLSLEDSSNIANLRIKEAPIIEYADNSIYLSLKDTQSNTYVKPKITIEYADDTQFIELTKPSIVQEVVEIPKEESKEILEEPLELTVDMPERIKVDQSLTITGSIKPAKQESIEIVYIKPGGEIITKHTITDLDGNFKDTIYVDKDGIWRMNIKSDTISKVFSFIAEDIVIEVPEQKEESIDLDKLYVNLYTEKREVKVGEKTKLTLAVVNPITSPGNLNVQLTLQLPSGLSIESSKFGSNAGGLQTALFNIPPGDEVQNIEVDILANEELEGTIKAFIDYYYAGFEDQKRSLERSIDVRVNSDVEQRAVISMPENTTETKQTDKISTPFGDIDSMTFNIIITLIISIIGGVIANAVFRKKS